MLCFIQVWHNATQLLAFFSLTIALHQVSAQTSTKTHTHTQVWHAHKQTHTHTHAHRCGCTFFNDAFLVLILLTTKSKSGFIYQPIHSHSSQHPCTSCSGTRSLCNCKFHEMFPHAWQINDIPSKKGQNITQQVSEMKLLTFMVPVKQNHNSYY